jgi:hypothetical protein
MITTAQHATYRSNKKNWMLSKAMYTGEGAHRHLQKRFFEHDKHHQQRQKDADFTPMVRMLLGRLTGFLFQRSEEIERSLGVLDEEDLESAGPEGEDYKTLLMSLTETLLLYNRAYVVLNPSQGIRVVDPLQVPNWTTNEYVVKGSMTLGNSVFEDVQSVDTWTRYMPSGYETYTQVEKKNGEVEEELQDAGLWIEDEEAEDVVQFVDSNGMTHAPVIKMEMPWNTNLGLQLANKYRNIFDLESRRDFALSTAMNGIIQVGVGDSEEMMEMIEKQARRGSYIWPYDKSLGEHKGLQIPTDGIDMGTDILEEKKNELHEVAYKELKKAGQQTATEAELRHSGGAGAALTVIAQTIEDADRQILHMMNQAKDYTLAQRPNDIEVSTSYPTSFQTDTLLNDV